jgi:hypothetical protein
MQQEEADSFTLEVSQHFLVPHCKQYCIYVFPEKISQASLLSSTKYFQNRIIMFGLDIMERLKYTRCSHSAVSIGNNIFPNGVMKFQ